MVSSEVAIRKVCIGSGKKEYQGAEDEEQEIPGKGQMKRLHGKNFPYREKVWSLQKLVNGVRLVH